MIAQKSLDRLKESINIEKIISNFVPLKKKGRNFVGCCPFHGEKTPSFTVSPQNQTYHCFGCGVGGDTIKFVQEYKKVDFIEAVQDIAQMVNFTLEYTTTEQNNNRDILKRYQNVFREELENYPQIQSYIKSRGVNAQSIAKFEIGYATDTRTQKAKSINYGFLEKELIEEDIFAKDGSRVYARFTERVMFPIYTPNGKICGWGGRSQKEGVAKYLNSPQSKQFDKSKLLYGYHLAKDSIYKTKEIIICEGYLDVVLSHQHDIINSVATLGTALTQNHVSLIQKTGARVKLVFDGDKAGYNAGLKGAELLAQNGVDGEVVILPKNQDPTDMLSSGKLNQYRILIGAGVPFIRFVLLEITNKYNLDNPIQKAEALKETVTFLKSIKNKLIAEEYITFLSLLLGINPKYIILSSKEEATIKSLNPKITLEDRVLRAMMDDERLIHLAIDKVSLDAWQDKKTFFEITGHYKTNVNLSRLKVLDVSVMSQENFLKACMFIQKEYLLKLRTSLQTIEELENFRG